MPDSWRSTTAADRDSGWSSGEEVDVIGIDAQPARCRAAAATVTSTHDRQRPHRGWRDTRSGRLAAAGPAASAPAAARAVSGRTSVSSVGTKTSEIAKSTMTPMAAPMPNVRTATTSLVASDSMPSAVVPLAPSSGANRWLTDDLNACSLSPVARSSWSKCCTMCTSSAIASTMTSGGSMLVRTLNVNPIGDVQAERPDHADARWPPAISSVLRTERNIA